MKISTLLLFIFLFADYSFGQIKFENGYFINNSGNKISCLIKNMDWKNNPTDFEYKLSETDKIQTATVQSVKEFGVDNYSKYVREVVDMDTSIQTLNLLEKNPNPEYKQMAVFLKVALEGKATLYSYEKGNLRKYFLSLDNEDLIPLIYKLYLYDERNIGTNKTYQQQLLNQLQSKNISLAEIERTNYAERDIAKLIKKYNSANGSSSVTYNLQKKVGFHFSIKPRTNLSSLEIRNTGSGGSNLNSKFENKFNFSAGIEGEFVLPYYKSKLSIPVEIDFQYFKSNSTTQYGPSSVNYTSIEIPVGLRYSLFLNDASKIFINGLYVFDFVMANSKIVVKPSPDLKIETHGNLAVGVGYQYEKWSAEIRYFTKRDVLTNYTYWNSSFNSVSLIVGYRLF